MDCLLQFTCDIFLCSLHHLFPLCLYVSLYLYLSIFSCNRCCLLRFGQIFMLNKIIVTSSLINNHVKLKWTGPWRNCALFYQFLNYCLLIPWPFLPHLCIYVSLKSNRFLSLTRCMFVCNSITIVCKKMDRISHNFRKYVLLRWKINYNPTKKSRYLALYPFFYQLMLLGIDRVCILNVWKNSGILHFEKFNSFSGYRSRERERDVKWNVSSGKLADFIQIWVRFITNFVAITLVLPSVLFLQRTILPKPLFEKHVHYSVGNRNFFSLVFLSNKYKT